MDVGAKRPTNVKQARAGTAARLLAASSSDSARVRTQRFQFRQQQRAENFRIFNRDPADFDAADLFRTPRLKIGTGANSLRDHSEVFRFFTPRKGCAGPELEAAFCQAVLRGVGVESTCLWLRHFRDRSTPKPTTQRARTQGAASRQWNHPRSSSRLNWWRLRSRTCGSND